MGGGGKGYEMEANGTDRYPKGGKREREKEILIYSLRSPMKMYKY